MKLSNEFIECIIIYCITNDKPIDIDYINNLKVMADDILDVSNGIIVHDLIKKESSRIGECVRD